MESVYQSTVLIRNKPSSPMFTLTIASSLVLTTLAGADSLPPRCESHWPTPQRLQSVAVSVSTIPGDVTFVVPSGVQPFSQAEWPNPYRPFRLAVGVSTTPGDAAVAEEVEAAPIVPLDWPLPRARVRQRRDDTLNLQATTLAPISGNPFRQTDWPVVRRPKLAVQDYVSYYVIDETSPFSEASWPNPSHRKRSIDRLTWTHNRSLMLSEPAPPFSETVWPNPLAKGPSPELRKWTATRALSLVDATPLASTEWLAPPALRRSSELLTWTQNLTQTTLALSDTPFVPVEFPTPQQKARATDLRTHIEVRQFYYADEYPFSQTEWPLAVVRSKRLPETWTDNLLESSLAIAQEPFIGTDRPNPAPRRHQPLSYAQNLLDSTLAPEPSPHVQQDWPLFLARPPAIDLRTWIGTRQAYHEDALPFATEWPIPAPLRRAKGLGHWTVPEIGILGNPATVDVRVVVRADVGVIVVRADIGSVEP